MFIKYKLLFLINFALFKKQMHILLGYFRLSEKPTSTEKYQQVITEITYMKT